MNSGELSMHVGARVKMLEDDRNPWCIATLAMQGQTFCLNFPTVDFYGGPMYHLKDFCWCLADPTLARIKIINCELSLPLPRRWFGDLLRNETSQGTSAQRQ
jgi:hypothetical protein